MNFASTKERILKYLDYKGISKADFYILTGIKRGLLDADKLKSAVSDVFIAKIIAVYPDISLNWLITGRGDMLKEAPGEEVLAMMYAESRAEADNLSDNKTPYLTTLFHMHNDKIVRQQSVPLFELEAWEGLASLLNNADNLTPEYYISIPNLPPCDGGIYVRGDSMYPLLKSGDIVLYKQVSDPEMILGGEMYLLSFTYNDEEYISVKYVNRIEGDDERVKLVSYNAHHSPIVIYLSEIRALAIIKASIRYHTMG